MNARIVWSCRKRVEIALAPGESIGTAGGREGQNALDVGAADARISDPAKPVSSSSVHCWDVSGGRVLGALADQTHLSIDFETSVACGAGPWTITSPVAFER